MAVDTNGGGNDDFASFFRRYGRSGIHAGAAALLTLFALLYSVTGNPLFAAVGVAIYVLPPAYLYVSQDDGGSGEGADRVDAADGSAADAATSAAAEERRDPDTAAGSADRGDGPDEPGIATTGHEAGDDTEADDEADTGDDESASDEPDTRDDGSASDEPEREPAWTTPQVPTDVTLRSVAAADGDAYAVGDGGVLLTRGDDGWETVFDGGPSAEGETLRGVDVADGGRTAWVAGDGGALAVYDAEADRHVDLSAPEDLTSTWNDVAVSGSAGEETVYLVDGSGAVLRGSRAGDDPEPTWVDPTKPGSGSSLTAVVADSATGRVVACDSNGSVFESTDGDEFERVGIDGADALHDVAASERGVIETVAADGKLHRRDDGIWTPRRLDDAWPRALDRADEVGVVVGEGRTALVDEGDGWEPVELPRALSLQSVAVGRDGDVVAVGHDDGTVLEREGA